jgi:hypothetical protein
MVVAPASPPSATASSSNNGMLNLGIYSIITLVYLWVDYIKNSNADASNTTASPASPSSKYAYAFIFLGIILLTQFSLTYNSLQQQCNTPNYGLAAWSSFATFAVMFMPLFWCLEYVPAWLQPFGNTFGYLFNKLNGLVSFMDSILRKDPGTDKIQKYLDYMREDPWALFSMLTTSANAPESINASKKFEELSSGGYITSTGADAKSTFVDYVRTKESVAKFVFYVLTLNLMSDLTFIIAQENSPCAINIDELNDAATSNPTPTMSTNPAVVYKTSE